MTTGYGSLGVRGVRNLNDIARRLASVENTKHVCGDGDNSHLPLDTRYLLVNGMTGTSNT